MCGCVTAKVREIEREGGRERGGARQPTRVMKNAWRLLMSVCWSEKATEKKSTDGGFLDSAALAVCTLTHPASLWPLHTPPRLASPACRSLHLLSMPLIAMYSISPTCGDPLNVRTLSSVFSLYMWVILNMNHNYIFFFFFKHFIHNNNNNNIKVHLFQ